MDQSEPAAVANIVMDGVYSPSVRSRSPTDRFTLVAELVYPPVIALARGVFALQGLRFTLRGTEHVPRTRRRGDGHQPRRLPGLHLRRAGGPAGRTAGAVHGQGRGLHPPGQRSADARHAPHPGRPGRGRGSYRHAVDALRAGEIVGVFPEATISRSFELKDFKAGAVRMAAEAGVPVLPDRDLGIAAGLDQGPPQAAWTDAGCPSRSRSASRSPSTSRSDPSW